MAGFVQPLSNKFPIVDKDGKPTGYFIEWAQQKQLDIQDAVSVQEATDIAIAVTDNALTDRDINTTGGLQGGGSLSADRTLSLTDTGVTPGSYTNTNLTVDAKGRITAASNGSGGGGGGGVPTFVQAKSIARANLSGGITLDAAPGTGSLLVAIVFNATLTTPPVAGGGWTAVQSDNNLPDHAVFFRITGAGESATQAPTSTTDGGCIVMYEFSGAAGVLGPAATTFTSTSGSQSFVTSSWDLLAATSGQMIGFSGRRTSEAGTMGGSFTNLTAGGVNGASGTTGGTGVSIVSGYAAKNPGASLPSSSVTWPTSVATKVGLLLVY